MCLFCLIDVECRSILCCCSIPLCCSSIDSDFHDIRNFDLLFLAFCLIFVLFCLFVFFFVFVFDHIFGVDQVNSNKRRKAQQL